MQHTLKLAPELWRVLDQAHNKRNRAEDEGDVEIEIGWSKRCFAVPATCSRK